MNNPLLICLTPVRNEAWILEVFLKATSLWADYIIIADQMSTDGSREIALNNPKVILIDNNNQNYNEADRQKLLITKAREIDGEKILFALDADEIFTANFRVTNDWEKIINSQKGDVFWFKWAQVRPDKKHYFVSKNFFPWVFHDDGIEPHGNYARNMHSMRIPYPIEEKQMYYVEEFKVLHFQPFFPKRNESKQRFYMFVDYNLNGRSIIDLSRLYFERRNIEKNFELNEDMIYTLEKNGFNLFDLINTSNRRFWFDKYIVDSINKDGTDKFRNVNIWDKSFMNEYKIKDPRNTLNKLLHYYLRKTQNYSSVFLLIDKLLKKIGF